MSFGSKVATKAGWAKWEAFLNLDRVVHSLMSLMIIEGGWSTWTRLGARLGTVDHGDASDGVFHLLYLQVLPLRWAILLPRSPFSLSLYLVDGLSVWMALSIANGGPSRDLGLKILRVIGKGGRTDAGTGPGPPDPARSPLRSRGSSCDYALCPLHLHYFDNVILASKMEVLFAWRPIFYASILGDVPS
jgi:hypothetical protein